MGLLNNNFRDSFGTTRFFGATLSNGASPYVECLSNRLPGGERNLFASDADISNLSAKPAGARIPQAWLMPQKPGGLASRNEAIVSFTPQAFAVQGLPGSGSSTITFTTTATGGLVVSGSGSASITFSATGSILSIAAGSGSATVSLSASGLIGALAGLAGSTSITLTPAATIKAIGYMEGLSTNETEFSAAALANAVWSASTSDFNVSGTMGKSLNDAGAAGNPWAALLDDNNDPGTFGERVQKLLTVAKFLGLK